MKSARHVRKKRPLVKPIEPLRPSKFTRRWILRIVFFFCLYWMGFIIYHGGDSGVRQIAFAGLVVILGWIVFIYIKGGSDDVASWNDTIMKLRGYGGKTDDDEFNEVG